MTLRPTAFHVDDGSKPKCFLNPYTVTVTQPPSSKSLRSEVDIWSCQAGKEPTHVSSLEGKVLDPAEHLLLTPQRVLTRTVYGPIELELSDLIVHDIISGREVDSITNLPIGHLAHWGTTPLLGSCNVNIAVWRIGHGNGVIELYTLEDESNLVLSNTLQPPLDLPPFEVGSNPGTFIPPRLISFRSESDPPDIICHSCRGNFPTAFHLSRWTSNSTQTIHASFMFQNATPPDDEALMISVLKDYLVASSLQSVVLAHEESAFERTDDTHTTTLYSIDTETFQSNWTISLMQRTSKLRYIEKMGVILAIGDTPIQGENYDGTPSERRSELTWRASVVVVDAHSGAIRTKHLILPSEHPCGSISSSGIGYEVDVLRSEEKMVVVSIYGDGQSAIVPVEQFVEHGFPKVDRMTATVPYPGTPPSTPKNRKQRKEKENGVWAWVERAIFADDQVVLKIKDSTGWAIMSWK